ncbi:MAG TPA: DsbE family thiol:disulfide interchange protein [Rhodocyclaceae bacterium]
MRRFILPLVVLAVLVGFLAVGLRLNPREVPSPLIGRAAPQFKLPQLHVEQANFSPADLRGKVWLFNVWASWCVSCRQEHPVLVEFAKRGVVPVVGLDYKDERGAGLAWLQEHGDPYTLSVMDKDGRVGIDFGVYGVPETFVIDKAGVIRYKHTGPLTQAALDQTIVPLLKELNGA